ncbi:sigma-70 family RNA polymerase sigma factor [Salirhabdus sp. Marseille-P4669]|uniref:sigma-70 family RNA polymerase sigma factor n=1 Tax=Salirhabdus sp. Marseille-P4669 TaxID=2042310 RepID=UPI000C7BDC5E|nr:sigma-70 family RNA polymerase sigma factor [Salirhabdus sp. Marseille-P4669]
MNNLQPFEANRDFYMKNIMNQYGRSLMNFAYTYVKDWSLAEDIIQEVFISVYRYSELKQVHSLKSWLYMITSNKCKDFLRKSYVKNDILAGIRGYFWKDHHHTPEKILLSTSKNKMISLHILNLPVKYREVIILFYYEDLSIKEIGELLQQKESTVKSKLLRGREKLKLKLKTEASDWFE